MSRSQEELNLELIEAGASLFVQFRDMDDESFSVMQVACTDEINRCMDEGDLTGELLARLLQAVCDSVARHRP